MTREDIIAESIDSLKKDGLKFSIDMLAERLKISKKTVYKFFSSKEELAQAVYETFYTELENTAMAENADEWSERELTERLSLYYESARMNCSDIFNKYALNDVIKAYAACKHAQMWDSVARLLAQKFSPETVRAFKIMTDGAFERVGGDSVTAKRIIALLRCSLC